MPEASETPTAEASPAAEAAADQVAESQQEAEQAVAEARKPRKRGQRKRKARKAQAAVQESETAYDKLLRVIRENSFYGGKTPGAHSGPKPGERTLADGEREITLPTRLRDGKVVTVTLRWKPPARGKWHVATSARAARWWHVVPDEGEPGAGKTLCNIPTHSWSGGPPRVEDKAKQPITCPFCLARMLDAGLVTEAAQRKVFSAWQSRTQREADKAAKEAEAEPAPAA